MPGPLARRELIRRAAVLGAGAWTAPLILDSLASPAAAATVVCTGAPLFGAVAGTDYFTNEGSSGNATVNRPTGTTPTDVLIVGLMFQNGSNVGITPVDTAWNFIRRDQFAGDIGVATYWKREAATPASYQFNLSNGAGWCIGISRWSCTSSATTTATLFTHTGTNGDGGTPTVLSLNTPVNNCAVLLFFTNKKMSLWGTVSGTPTPNERYDDPNNSADVSNMMASFVQSTAGATGSRTSNPTIAVDKWATQTLALRPAGT